MTAKMLDPRSDRPPFQNPLSTGRLICEWKQTADKRITCTWTLRDANLASVPKLSPEEMTLQPDVRQDRFLVWILRPPRQARTILGMAAAVVFLGLATADLSGSATTNLRQTGHVSMATTVARSAMVDNVQLPSSTLILNFSSELLTEAPEPGSGHQH